MSILISHSSADEKEAEARKAESKKDDYHSLIAACVAVVLIAVFSLSGMLGFTLKRERESVQTDLTTEAVGEIEPGDSIYLGTYLNEPIEWQVLKLSKDKKTAVVVSRNILTMKAYDTAESGKYNYLEGQDYWGEDITEESVTVQRLLRGDNRWSTSNIRAWLNAATENVTYVDQKPMAAAMSELKNGYDTEAGFLKEFTEMELAAIIETTVDTDGEITRDRVFLLSSKELEWLEEADVSLAAIPTQNALEQDFSDWYDTQISAYGIKDYNWWLRDAGTEADKTPAYEVYMVNNSYAGNTLISKSVGLEGFGIRPAMTIDLTSEAVLGTKQ